MRGLLFRAIKRNYETIKAATTLKGNPYSLEKKKLYFPFKIFRGPADLDETISQSVRASFKRLLSSCIMLRVAQTNQPYIIAESLLLPTASDMCKTMFAKDEYIKKLKSIPMPALLMNWQRSEERRVG